MLSAAKYLAAVVCLCGTLLAAEPSGLWLDIPFVRQSREGCGAASIAMVMQYWLAQAGNKPGDASDATFILRKLHSSRAHGIYASEMKNYLEQNGYRSFAFSGNWRDLEEHLQKGRPLIVALKPAAHEKALHYVVVAGLDEGYVLFNDPADRKLAKLDRQSFEKQWSATDKWTLLAVPESGGR